jgi:hypothetical protein
MGDMRVTLSQAREATADLADNMEAMKHNFLLRGFFNRRGYFDLDAISPADYRKGVLENGKRKAMRIWLGADVLFAPGPDGTEVLTDGGRARLDLEKLVMPHDATPDEILALSAAMTELERLLHRKHQVASLRFYAGCTNEETAAAMDVSPATVAREWRFARAWLHQRANALHRFGDRQQLLHACKIDSRRIHKPLDESQPLDLVARVQAHAADGARRTHQPEPFVLAKRLRMHVEHAGRIGYENQLDS